jgi:transposase
MGEIETIYEGDWDHDLHRIRASQEMDAGRCHRRSGQNHSGDARTQRQKFFERIPQGIAETVKEGVVEAGPTWGWIYDTLGELGVKMMVTNPSAVRAIAEAKI